VFKGKSLTVRLSVKGISIVHFCERELDSTLFLGRARELLHKNIVSHKRRVR